MQDLLEKIQKAGKENYLAGVGLTESPGHPVLACLFSYRPKDLDPGKKPSWDGGLWAKVSRGEDYHDLVRRRAGNYGRAIQEGLARWGDLSFHVGVDTEPFPERKLAVEAGLGFIGRNQNLIRPGLGSFLFIACLHWEGEEGALDQIRTLFQADLLGAAPVKASCGSCRLCQVACPAGALEGEGAYHRDRCISYLTQKKGVLPPEEGRLLGHHFYGCDECQDICPYNRSVKEADLPPTDPALLGEGSAWISCKDFLQSSKKDILARYGKRSGLWRGVNQLRKNALLVMANAGWEDLKIRDEARPIIKEAMTSPSLQVRETAGQVIASWEKAEDKTIR